MACPTVNALLDHIYEYMPAVLIERRFAFEAALAANTHIMIDTEKDLFDFNSLLGNISCVYSVNSTKQSDFHHFF